MRQRGDATGAMNDADHDLRRRPGTRYKCGAVVAEETIKGFLRVRDMAGALQRTRDLWPADGAAKVALRLVEQLPQIDRHTELGEPRSNRMNALDARLALHAQEVNQPLLGGIEEVA